MKIGLTGGIGSGKSIVAKVLESRGYPVFYSDLEAKRIVESPKIQNQITQLLGSSSYREGVYQTDYVSKMVFGNPSLLKQLNQIIHPAVREGFSSFYKTQKKNLVFNEAAILVESGGASEMDAVVLVSAPEDIRIARVLSRNNLLTREDVLKRISRQWTDEQKRPHAHFEIINDESRSVLIQIDQMLAHFQSFISS